MADVLAITEEMHVHDKWYEQAKEQTIKTLPTFVKELVENYTHDYGTICHAIAAAAIAGAYAVEHSPQGGITGFQSGAIMWEFIKHWGGFSSKIGLRLQNYEELLYPQYDYKFITISQEIWVSLQEEARNLLSEIREKEENFISKTVIDHWLSIADGKVPFGLSISANN